MQVLRSLTRRYLRSFGYDIRRYVSECGAAVPMLDLAVAVYCVRGDLPYFVQIGANDGVTDDPLHHLVLKYQLPGLLIEPMPEAFDQLQKNYAGRPGIAFENAALWDADGERDLFRFRPADHHDPRAKGMAGFDREVLLAASRRLPALRPTLETIRVQTRKPKTILEKHGVRKVDVLVVDTEGFDDHVAGWVLDLGVKPAIIRYEHIHLSPERQDAFAWRLNALGYRFTRSRTDTLALLDDQVDNCDRQ